MVLLRNPVGWKKIKNLNSYFKILFLNLLMYTVNRFKRQRFSIERISNSRDSNINSD